MTGYLRIGGALIMGVLIVLGAFYMTAQEPSSAAVASIEAAPPRSYIEAPDADMDGIPDWEEEFTKQALEKVEEAPATTTASDYKKPTTFTGKFSEAFFQDYLQGKVNGADYLSDPSELVNGAVKAIDENTRSKTYSFSDIQIGEDSDAALRAYGNEIARIITIYSLNNENEAVITQRALSQNNPEELKKLAPIKETYARYIADTLRVSVPPSLREEHLNLLNAYEAIYTDIAGMELAFSDPLYALARIEKYRGDATAFGDALKAIREELSSKGIAYARDEYGALFYTLNI